MRAGALILLAGALIAQAPSQWQELRRAARTAREAKDYSALRDNLRKLYALAPGHPGMVYNQGAVEALLGNRDAALDWLRRYAEMGFAWDIAADADFANIRQSDGFKQIEARMAENRKPVSHSQVAFTLPEKDLLAEDITYDPKTKMFYVSSVHHRKILAIDHRGAAREFIREGQDGVWAMLAVAVDAKRRLLWASTAAMGQALGHQVADAGRSAMLKYDLRTGKQLKRYDLQRVDGQQHVLGDMTLSPAGDVYVGDASGAVYMISHSRDVLELLVGPGEMVGPQTPALTPDGKRLFVADYGRGIAIVDLASRAVSWLATPKNLGAAGIDGLYLAGRELIAVQNGTSPIRIIRIQLDPLLTRAESWQVIEANTPALGTPTHAVVVGRDLYFIGNSGWDNFADEGPIKPGAAFQPPQILKVRLTP
jgi:hypothetical protein